MPFLNVKSFACAAAASLLANGLAFGQTTGAGVQAPPESRADDVVVFGGLRLWAANWDAPVVNRLPTIDAAGNPVSRDVEQGFSSTKVAPIPFIGVRYRNFLASISYLARTSFDSKGTLRGDIHREELDLTLGYYVLPQLALSVGYKSVKADRVTPLADGGSKSDGILLGATASVPLEASGRFSLYGNFAYGVGRSKYDVPLPDGNTKLDVDYRISEIGLSYGLFSAPQGALKQLTLSVGYRAQLVKLKDGPFGTYRPPTSTTPVSIDRKDLKTTTDGLVVGLIGVF